MAPKRVSIFCPFFTNIATFQKVKIMLFIRTQPCNANQSKSITEYCTLPRWSGNDDEKMWTISLVNYSQTFDREARFVLGGCFWLTNNSLQKRGPTTTCKFLNQGSDSRQTHWISSFLGWGTSGQVLANFWSTVMVRFADSLCWEGISFARFQNSCHWNKIRWLVEVFGWGLEWERNSLFVGCLGQAGILILHFCHDIGFLQSESWVGFVHLS